MKGALDSLNYEIGIEKRFTMQAAPVDWGRAGHQDTELRAWRIFKSKSKLFQRLFWRCGSLKLSTDHGDLVGDFAKSRVGAESKGGGGHVNLGGGGGKHMEVEALALPYSGHLRKPATQLTEFDTKYS